MTTAFAFRAVHANGTFETGTVEATDRESAVSLIRARGVFPIEVSAHQPLDVPARTLSADDLALGLRALASLLTAGVPLARALNVLPDIVPPAWAAAVPELARSVQQGDRLSAALSSSALPLPLHIIGIVEAGEGGSGLAPAMERAAQLLESRAATRAALRNALAYPALLATAGTASVGLLVGIVLPRFAALIADAGQTLPVMTRLVIGAGDFIRAAWLPGFVVIVAALVAARRWLAQPENLARWHAALLRAPVIGTIRRSAAASNACASLAALLDAGVPLTAALPHAARATGDHAIATALLAARSRIGAGERISSAIDNERALTPTAARLIRIAEEAGGLAPMLSHAARLEGAHALQSLQRLVRIVEPTLILLFGGLVMIVAAALLQAMYSLRP
jgi:general secretion pathway protein F